MQKFGRSEKLAYLCRRKRGKTPPGKGGGRTPLRESDLWKGLHRQETVHKTSEANRRFYNGSRRRVRDPDSERMRVVLPLCPIITEQRRKKILYNEEFDPGSG